MNARFSHARWFGPALAACALLPLNASAQLRDTFFSRNDPTDAALALATPCRGPVRQVSDLADEGVRTTGWNFSTLGGGGVGARFDPVPLLTTKVKLVSGCLNAHLSAMVGNQWYGVSNMTLFQVTLTAPTGALLPMIGHYPTPYGAAAPAVALTAEYDVDMLGANFYMPIGTGSGQVPPGSYQVDVWWAGGPTAPGGAIGAAFTLKLYLR
jgi:hypothetical protein